MPEINHTCSTPDCGRPAHSKGVCARCYSRAHYRAKKEAEAAGVVTPAPGVTGASPTPPPRPAPETPDDGIASALLSVMAPHLRGEVERIIAETAGQRVTINWTVNQGPFAEVEGLHHPDMQTVLRRVAAGFNNILLVGPSGSGKTHLVQSVAKSMALDYAHISCSAGMPEWHLLGRSFPSLNTGESIYKISEFVRLYENGGVFLLDEVDAADANVMIVLNSALANGHLSIPARTEKPVALRHEKFILIAAANTFGNGANRQYVGRNQLDAATLSRFACATISVDYSRELERALVPEKDIQLRVWGIRDRVAELSLRRIVGTRELIAYARLIRAGFAQAEALGALTEGWTADEKSKVGV